MGFEVAVGSAEARVRAVRLRRDVARGMTSIPAYVVVHPLSPPRLWRWIADEVVSAFEKSTTNLPANADTLRSGLDAAANAITRIRNQLIEPHLILDARIGALMTAPDGIHVALTMGVRLYRARGGIPERLFPRAERPAGIASGPAFLALERFESNDLFVLGTRDSFTVRSIGNLASSLAKNPKSPAAELCEAVIAPCREGGIGAATTVLRIS